jgi:hypothetical protein
LSRPCTCLHIDRPREGLVLYELVPELGLMAHGGDQVRHAPSRHPVTGREEQYQEDSSQLCKVSRGDQDNTDPRSVSRPERSTDTQFISQDRSREIHEAQQDRTDKQRELHNPHSTGTIVQQPLFSLYRF